jgi:putative glutamate/gamma-aminobutyrate antiporter
VSGKNPRAKERTIGVIALALINVAAIDTLRNLPAMAEYGFSLVFFLIFCSVFFFIPSALVSAELATGWPKAGGVYLWVKEGIGPKWGFVAIFMQWVENLPWFPAVLAYVASTIAYVFNPSMANNKLYTVIIIWVAMWLCTFANFKGMKWSAFLSSSGALVGTLVPGILIIGLGAAWVYTGKEIAIPFTADAFFPNINNMQQLMLLAAMLMALAGMEMSAVHVHDVKNPTKDYPRAIFLSAAIIIILAIAGALAIAIVIPSKQLSLSAGVMEAFDEFLKVYHLHWATPILAVLIAYGGLTMTVTWMVGPSKGLLEVAKEGYLPRIWQKRNKHNMPTGILWIQGGASCLLSLVILFMPTVSSAFWLMSVLAAQLYMIMYLLMFAAAIRLRYTQPDVKRAYRVPGGAKAGMWIVGGSGCAASFFAITCGFLPPASVIKQGTLATVGYVTFLLVGCVICTAVPIILFNTSKNKPHWKLEEVTGGKGHHV